jgi:ABC-type dipeptide/oligopeptide/nickel transport system ATPase component
MLRPPSGCAFHPRCRFADLAGRCVDEVPELRPIGATNHRAACHFAEDIVATSIAKHND